MKRIFRYLADKQTFGIMLNEDNTKGLETYCDSDYRGDSETSKSTTGIVITYCGSPIHWRSVRQKKITKSTTEAELTALVTAVEDAIWIRNVAIALNIMKLEPVPIYCDNSAAVTLATTVCGTQRTRHMTVQPRWIKEKVDEGCITVHHVPGEDQIADMLTKPLSITDFQENCSYLMKALEKEEH